MNPEHPPDAPFFKLCHFARGSFKKVIVIINYQKECYIPGYKNEKTQSPTFKADGKRDSIIGR